MCEAQERRRLLFESFTPVKSKFAFANSKVCVFVYVYVCVCVCMSVCVSVCLCLCACNIDTASIAEMLPLSMTHVTCRT